MDMNISSLKSILLMAYTCSTTIGWSLPLGSKQPYVGYNETDVLLKLEKHILQVKDGSARQERTRSMIRNLREDILSAFALSVDVADSQASAIKGSETAGQDRLVAQELEKICDATEPRSKVQGWGRNHAVSNYIGNQERPSIAKDSQGRLYIAYDWFYPGTNKYEIWLARSVDGGNTWEDLFYLGHPSYNYWRPSLAISSNDQCFLFYQTDDVLGLQFLKSSGGDKWYLYYISAWHPNYQRCHWPKVAVGLKNDSVRVAVAWMYDYNGNGSDYDIGYAYSRNGGANWIAAWSRIAGSTSQERFPSICISDSLIAVAYEFYGNWATNDSVDIRYSHTGGLSAPQDTAWSVGINGIATNRHDRQPALAASGRYLYLAGQRAWNDQDDYDIWIRHTNNGGKTLRVIEINESFESSTAPPTGWTNGGCHHTTNNPRTGARALCFNAVGDYIITPKLVNPDSVVFWYRRSTNTNAWACSVAYSHSLSGPWTLMGVINNPSTTYQQYSYNFTGLKNIYIRLKDARPGTGAEERYVDDFWVPSEPFVLAAGTAGEERHPALSAQDTICYLGYFQGGSWAACRKTFDQGYNWSAEELASDSNSAVQGTAGLSLCLLGDNPRVAWTDSRNFSWGLGRDIYFNTDLRHFPRTCDLAPFKPTNWQFPLVPSKLRGTFTVSDTLRGFGTGIRDTTYIDLCIIDSSAVDVADTFRTGLFVDEWLYAFIEDFRLPAWWTLSVTDYPLRIFGGRHTLSLNNDYDGRILYERTKDNNIFSRQWVWTPYRMPDDTTLQVPTPPVDVIDPSIPHYNCDGYWQASTNYWSAVALKSTNGSNYKLRVYTDDYGKNSAGFSVVAAESDLGSDTVDIVAINGNKLSIGTRYYPGVYRRLKDGEGDYYLQFCLQDGTIPNNGWSLTERRMGEYHIVHTYDVNLTAGIRYYAACSLRVGPASLGFAVFSPKGAVFKPRMAAVGSFNNITSPGQQFSFVADTTGWYAFVVWHNTPGKDDTSRYFVGVNTVPFGLPLAVSLSQFVISTQDSIVLRWRTESEENSYQWLIERGTEPERYVLLGTLPAAGTSTVPREYRWCDHTALDNTHYYYRLGEQALDGRVTYYGPLQARLVSVRTPDETPRAAPNPFRQKITISYHVPDNAKTIRLAVYNIAGQRVRTLVHGTSMVGSQQVCWDGRDEGGRMVGDGCYFLRWEIGGKAGKHKLIKVR